MPADAPAPHGPEYHPADCGTSTPGTFSIPGLVDVGLLSRVCPFVILRLRWRCPGITGDARVSRRVWHQRFHGPRSRRAGG